MTKEHTMRQELTPYDTGARLEPHPWVAIRGHVATPVRWCADAADREPDPEDFGRVDFDDDQGRTVLTAYVARGPDGCVLHLEDLVEETLTVTGGTEAIVIGLQHSLGLEELLSLAERGHEDFLHQARHGDYTVADDEDAAQRWTAARRAAAAIRTASNRQQGWKGQEGEGNQPELLLL